MSKTMGYVGWLIPETTRDKLLKLFPPAYDKVMAHHCTLRYGVSSDVALPHATSARIVGTVDDECGVQALVIEIDNSQSRPGGGTYHITWSLGDGRKPAESNRVIETTVVTPVSPPMLIDIVPQFFPVNTKKR